MVVSSKQSVMRRVAWERGLLCCCGGSVSPRSRPTMDAAIFAPSSFSSHRGYLFCNHRQASVSATSSRTLAVIPRTDTGIPSTSGKRESGPFCSAIPLTLPPFARRKLDDSPSNTTNSRAWTVWWRLSVSILSSHTMTGCRTWWLTAKTKSR